VYNTSADIGKEDHTNRTELDNQVGEEMDKLSDLSDSKGAVDRCIYVYICIYMYSLNLRLESIIE
jgi:hypothetical protein